MAFEKFTKVGRGAKPLVSIWVRGQIGFNRGAAESLKLADYKYVVLYFDPDERRIGFQFTNEEDVDGAIALKVRKTGVSMGAKFFLDYYQVDRSKTRRYELNHEKETNLHVINLSTEETSEEDNT